MPQLRGALVALILLAAGLGSAAPAQAAVHDSLPGGSPSTGTAYVANAGSDTVTPIATATNTPGPPIPVGDDPSAIAITPDGTTVYVGNIISGTVTPIATATNTPGTPIPVGNDPNAIAITPNTVPKAPAFTSASASTAAFGVPYTFTMTTTGEPAPTITRTGRMPTGLHFTRTGNGTATISGTPANGAAGIYPLTLTAQNSHGTATQSFTLTVTRAPYLRKIHTIRARDGVTVDWTFRAHGYPAPALTESGHLPAGLSFFDNGNGTATISGIPATGSGRYLISIIATNASGVASLSVTLLVAAHHGH